jgi:hypothetical protein
MSLARHSAKLYNELVGKGQHLKVGADEALCLVRYQLGVFRTLKLFE